MVGYSGSIGSRSRVFEVVLVHLLVFVALAGREADIVIDREFGESLAVDEHNPADLAGGIDRALRGVVGRKEHALRDAAHGQGAGQIVNPAPSASPHADVFDPEAVTPHDAVVAAAAMARGCVELPQGPCPTALS